MEQATINAMKRLAKELSANVKECHISNNIEAGSDDTINIVIQRAYSQDMHISAKNEKELRDKIRWRIAMHKEEFR